MRTRALVGVSLVIWLAIEGMIATLKFPGSPDAIHAPDVFASGNVQSVAQEASARWEIYKVISGLSGRDQG
jgi:hypothetical protein